MLLVIGSNWLTPTEGVSPYVCMEIELALQCKVKIIPVLVHDATMPSPDLLAPSIQSIVSLNANTVHALDPYFRTDMERLAPDLGIGKRTAARGGNYWGITHPRYQALSLLALATCICVIIYSTAYVILLGGSTNAPNLAFERWVNLAGTVFDVAATVTAVLFIVRTIVGKNWWWLAGAALVTVSANIARVVITVVQGGQPLTAGTVLLDYVSYGTVSHDVLVNSLVVPKSLLAFGMPAFVVLSFAAFGPTDRARRAILWAYLLVVLFCACWVYWYTFS